jgi:hypothetical protein
MYTASLTAFARYQYSDRKQEKDQLAAAVHRKLCNPMEKM